MLDFTNAHAIDSNALLDRLHGDLPEAPSPDVSARYMFIDTRKIVEDMADLGFQVTSYRRPRTRTPSGRFSVHEVEFRLPEHVTPRPEKVGDEVPRVLFINSYDGSRRAQILAGIFRLVCLNGMIAGDARVDTKFTHIGNYQDELVNHLTTASEQIRDLVKGVDRFKSVQMDPAARKGFATRLLKAYKDEMKVPELDIRVSTLLQPRRLADVDHNLWTTFNVVQEHLLKGGIPARTPKGERTLRPLANIERSNKVNQALWGVLEEMAVLAA